MNPDQSKPNFLRGIACGVATLLVGVLFFHFENLDGGATAFSMQDWFP